VLRVFGLGNDFDFSGQTRSHMGRVERGADFGQVQGHGT
jgi:hypothetical protein